MLIDLRNGKWKKFVFDFVSDYFDNSYIHGLRYLRKGNRFVGLFWLIFLFISITGCSYLIGQTYDKWAKSPVILSFDEKPVPTSTIPFPAVTICPELKFKSELFNISDWNTKKSTNQKRLENALHSICPFIPPSVYLSNINIIADLKSIAIPFADMFSSCLYHGITIRCDKLFFEVITDEGICYSFNMLNHKDILNDIIDESLKYPKHGKKSDNWTLQDGYTDISSTVYPERVVGSGLSMSLDIWLRVQKQDMEFKCKGFSSGFRLLMHSPTEIPRFSKDYYPIPLKKTVQFSVNPEVIKTVDGLKNYKPEIRQCYYDGEKPLKFFKVYTQSNCELECLSNYTQKSCNCVKLGQPHDHGTRMCSSMKKVCYNKAESFLTNETLNQNNDEEHLSVDDCKCLPSCTSLEYTAEISQSDFYYEEYFNALHVTQQENMMMSRIKIYFKKNQFVALKRSELFGLTDFLSNCGGLLGLFMGFSILSIIELVYYVSLRCMCVNKNQSVDSKVDTEQLAAIKEITEDEVEEDKEEIKEDEFYYIEYESM